MNNRPILCPYCGKEMASRLGTLNEHTGEYGGYMECPGCKARGPRVSVKKTTNLVVTARDLLTAQQAVTTAARCRYTQAIEPLTLEEAARLDLVFMEMKTESGLIRPVDAVIADNHIDCKLWRIGSERPYYFKIHKYGKTWRCWPRIPTEDERNAAAWEA